MLKLDENAVKINAVASTKEDAINQAGQLLVDCGYIKPEYIKSIFGREEIANTYLGNGICIPHGMQENRKLILNTGIAVLQLPNGVEWKDGKIAHIIVAIAAKTDEHIQILSQLTNLLSEEEKAKELAKTTQKSLILEALNGEVKKEKIQNLEIFDINEKITFEGYAGFHARPAALFVDIVNSYKSEVRLSFNEKVANGNSMAGILKLGITGGSEFIISTKGEDANEALIALCQSIKEGLNENIVEESSLKNVAKREYFGEKLEGIPAAPGIATGPIVIFNEDEISIQKEGKALSLEKERLKIALDKAISELNHWIHKKHENIDKQRMEIFIAHLALLKDPELQEKTFSRITNNINSAYTWWEVIQEEIKSLSSLSDARLSQRANDIKDIGTRVLKYLEPNSIKSNNVTLKKPSILISLDMTPSETSQLDKSKVLAIITVKGGSTSHTAILARAMGIPSIAGIDEAILSLSSNQAIADGDSGILVLRPTSHDLELAQELQKDAQALKEIEYRHRFKPAITKDNYRMEVVANIANEDAAHEAVENGAEGVGLVRTEFLFLQRNNAPTEKEQYQAYKKMVQHLNGLPLIIRTLDIGGDKHVPYLNMPKEDNPFLGVRGIRLCLEYKELFKEQLRAIYQASKYGPIKIMFPMVGLLEEFREACTIAEEVRLEVDANSIEIGMMIEVPSAVIMMEEFAKEADFFSVGTNDLTQYVLSMDRGHPTLAKKADALHPAVLRMIKTSCDIAKKHGKWVGVCGNLAANPLAAKILTGIGVKELSVASTSIASIKELIRNSDHTECETLAKKALIQESAEAVRSLED